MPTLLDMAKRIVAGELQQPPISRHLRAKLTAIEAGKARIELGADERLANPMGTLHGGVLCDIADAAMGMAYAATLGEGESFTTLELKINFLRPVTSARLAADGLLGQSAQRRGLT